MTVSEIETHIQKLLKPSRYKHSISVAKTAVELARIHGADEDKAYLAALLHDCAKCYDDTELFKKAEIYGIELDSVSKNNPKLIHSYVGAYEAKAIYGIDDEEILDAIYYHTIGKADMSKLCAVIYIADAIEPLRSYDGVEILRKASRTSLCEAVLKYTEMSIRHLIDRGEYIHPSAIETRNYYLEELLEQRY